MLAGLLDKSRFRNTIDWGFLLFLGITYSLGDIFVRLKIDGWLIGILQPVLETLSFDPIIFLSLVILLVYVRRIISKKSSTVMLLMLTLLPWVQELEIHPGVLLITAPLASEGWFLPYQDNSHQLVYYGIDRNSLSPCPSA